MLQLVINVCIIGQFGIVYRGILIKQDDEVPVPVAIKTLTGRIIK